MSGEIHPLVGAIREATTLSTGEIRIHISNRWLENARGVWKRAVRLFSVFRMDQTLQRNGVFIYLNLRSKRFAIVADEGLVAKTGGPYWANVAAYFRKDLHSTHFENALTLLVRTLGETLREHFPADLGC